MAERGEPRDVVDHIHDLIAQAPRLLRGTQLLAWLLVGGAHADKPLIHESEGERRCTAPAVRVSVRDRLSTQEAPALLKGSKDEIGNSEPVFAAQFIEPLKVDTALINRRNHRQSFGDAERVVLAAAGRGDVHDARPLLCSNITPRDDAVRGTICAECLCYGWGGVERGAIAPSHHLAPLLRLKHLGARCATAECGDTARRADPHLATVKLHQFIREGWAHRSGDVGGNRPRRCRPGQKFLTRSINKRESEVGRWVIAIGIPLRHLVLADAGAAPCAPRHAVAPLVKPAATVAFGEEAPDQIVVLIREGEVRATNLR